MSFDNRRGILGSPLGGGSGIGMDRGILGAPPGPMRGGIGMSDVGVGMPRDVELKSRIGMGLEEDITRSRHSQFSSSSGGDVAWERRQSVLGVYGGDSDMDRLQQLQRLNFGGNDGILGEPDLDMRPGMGGLGRPNPVGMRGGMGMDDSPRPLFHQADVNRFRATKMLEAHSGRGRRRDRMDVGRSARSPSPRRYRERSPIGMPYDPANPTGEGSVDDRLSRDRRAVPRDREPRGNDNSGMTVCHACHVDLGSNLKWREHMQSEGHMMVMQELGCKAEQQAFHLQREMRDNLRRRRRSPSAETADAQGEPKRLKERENNNHCKACEKEFFGPFHLHSELPEHRKKSSMIRDGCRWCNIPQFERFTDLQAHRASDEHLQKQREHDEERERRRQEVQERRYGLRPANRRFMPETEKSNASHEADKNGEAPERSNGQPSVNVDAEQCTVEDEEHKAEEPKEDPKESDEPVEASDDVEEVKRYPSTTLGDLPAEHNPNMALGQNYIKEVTGYFCKLCRRFYSNEELAFQSHCKSEAHFLKLKAYLQQKGNDGEISDDD